MYRFLLLYIGYDGMQYFAEGLIHCDKSVYVRGFYPEVGKGICKCYARMQDLKNALRDNDEIVTHSIHMIDEVKEEILK